MGKDAYYFPHDSNARNDEKIIAVRMKYGIEGYGIYFAILEKLRESADYKCVKDYNNIAFDLRVDASKVKDIIENFGLFTCTEDGSCIYSESFDNRMVPLDNLRGQRRAAGINSAKKRRELTTVQRPLKEPPTTVAKKSNKVNKSKVNKIKEDNNPPIIPPSGDEGELSFENVWILYGRKGNKKTSTARWNKLTLEAKKLARAHIPDYVAATPDEQYRKNFEVYISREGWNDRIIKKTQNNGARTTSNWNKNSFNR